MPNGGLAMWNDYFHWQKKVHLVLHNKEVTLEILFDDFWLHVLMLHPNISPNPWRKVEKPKGVPAFDSSTWLLVVAFFFGITWPRDTQLLFSIPPHGNLWLW